LVNFGRLWPEVACFVFGRLWHGAAIAKYAQIALFSLVRLSRTELFGKKYEERLKKFASP
jgi:hypothetical protein